MKTVLLMRHAEAHLEQGNQTDFDRTLTPDGEAMATQTGTLLRQLGISTCRIIASSAPRTLRTAQLLAAQACPSTPLLPLPELYNAHTDRLVNALLRHCCPDEDSIMLVAHNPGISSLMCRWSGRNLAVQPATLLVLTADVDDWTRFPTAAHTISLFVQDALLQPTDDGQ
ncbi:MAG: SixA phosphatase family protein [Planctomycetota bacterium]